MNIRKQISVQCASKYKRIMEAMCGKDKTEVLEDVRYDFIVNLDKMLEGWGYGRQLRELYEMYDAPKTPANIDPTSYELEEEKPKTTKKKKVEEVQLDASTIGILDDLDTVDKPCTLDEECDKYRDSLELPRTRKLRRTHAKDKRGDER